MLKVTQVTLKLKKIVGFILILFATVMYRNAVEKLNSSELPGVFY